MKILYWLGYLLGFGMMAKGSFEYLFRIRDSSSLIALGFIVVLISFSIRLIAPYLSHSNKNKQK